MNRVLVPPAASEMHSHFGEPVRGLTLLSTQKKSPASVMRGIFIGGEGGIRTLDTLLTYTPLAGARLQPLGHFSINLSTELPVKLVRRARSRVDS